MNKVRTLCFAGLLAALSSCANGKDHVATAGTIHPRNAERARDADAGVDPTSAANDAGVVPTSAASDAGVVPTSAANDAGVVPTSAASDASSMNDAGSASTCSQTLFVGDARTREDTVETNCSRDDTRDRSVCTCGNSRRGYRTYYVYDTGVDESCQVVQDLCALEAPPAFDGARRCSPQREIGAVGLCDTFFDCEQSSDAIENVTAWGYESLHCADSGDGTASCNCETDRHRFRFDLLAPITDATQCTEAMNVCSTCDTAREACSPATP